MGGTAEHALINEHPVNIFDSAGRLIENIDFTPGLPIARTDVESAFFAQDQWILISRVSLNIGRSRRTAGSHRRLAGRPARRASYLRRSRSGRTIFRAGSGVFYDRVPLNVYGFALYPDQIITTYNPDGTMLSGPFRYFNLTEARRAPPLAADLPRERRGGRFRALQHQLQYPGGADHCSPRCGCAPTIC